MNRHSASFHTAMQTSTSPAELDPDVDRGRDRRHEARADDADAEQQAAELKSTKQALEKFKSEASLGEARQFLTAAKDVGGLKVLTVHRDGMDANALRQMGDFLRDKEAGVVAVLSSVNAGKITFLAVCGKEAVAQGVKAGDLVKSVCAICGGKGGGKPDSAMGGGTDISKLDNALACVDDFVSQKLGL